MFIAPSFEGARVETREMMEATGGVRRKSENSHQELGRFSRLQLHLSANATGKEFFTRDNHAV